MVAIGPLERYLAGVLNPKLVVKDEALNDNDKVFTVPSGKTWKILWILVRLSTSATAGARRMEADFRDSANVAVWTSTALNTQAASATETYKWLPQAETPREALATAHTVPIPLDSLLPAGFSIRVFDKQNIAPATDDMNVYIMAEEFDT